MNSMISAERSPQIARCALLKVKRLLSQCAVLLLIAIPSARPQSPPAVQQLINELPQCSVLHDDLEHGTYGNGVDQPYMVRMRQQGVQRGEVELHAVLHGNRAEGIQIVRRLYFRQFDGPNSQISDDVTLKAIEASGLQVDLDRIARSRVLAAPFVGGLDPIFFVRYHVTSFVEFLANPWLLEQQVIWFPSGDPKPLTEPLLDGDALVAQTLLTSHRSDKRELDRGLFDAAISRYDNTAVFKLLFDAGADANTHTAEGVTPLMNAVAHPCNLRPLLDGGADLNARDKWGRTALEVARQQKQATAIRLLEEAAR